MYDQVQKKPLFFRRVLMNACRIYSRQGSLGGKLEEVCPVYTLCLLDHAMFRKEEDLVHGKWLEAKRRIFQNMQGDRHRI